MRDPFEDMNAAIERGDCQLMLEAVHEVLRSRRVDEETRVRLVTHLGDYFDGAE